MFRPSLLCLVALAPALLPAQDTIQAAGKDFSLALENQWVRVLREKQPLHSQTPLHQHPPAVVIYLTDAHQRITKADGAVADVTHKAGDVRYEEAARHAEENLSAQPLEAVIIELKPARIHAVPVSLDPVTLDPEHHIVEVNNGRVRVLRTILEPHLPSPMHQHPAYVVVYMTELHTTMKLADGQVVDNPRKPGEIAWRDPLQHQTENVGDHTAVEIQVELK